MHIIANSSELSQATSKLQGALTDKSLSQIGLKTNGTELTLSATDRLLAAYSTISCESKTDATIFVPSKLFSEVIKELPKGEVTLFSENAFLVIQAGEAKDFEMKIPLIDNMMWRQPPSLDEQFQKQRAKIPTAALSYLIDQTQFCVVQDSPRNYGTVAYLHKPQPGKLRMVGTDGFRLSYAEAELEVSADFLHNGICLSKRALSELSRLSSEHVENIDVFISDDETTLAVKVPGYLLFIRLSSVKYPNYISVIPEIKKPGLLVSRDQLQGVCKRVLLAADKSRALQLSFSKNALTLNSKTVGSSEGKEKIKLDDYVGPNFEVAINGKFLTDIFQTTSSENVTLSFDDENNDAPIVVTPRSEPADCRSKHVLVPIKQK